MMSVNLKLYIGVEGPSGREDSGDDQHQGKSALKCKNVYVIVSLKLEMKVSLLGCYTRSGKHQANIGLRFFL